LFIKNTKINLIPFFIVKINFSRQTTPLFYNFACIKSKITIKNRKK